jgi:ABC-type dipeptide/oligopeptide/nickel transport system permease component
MRYHRVRSPALLRVAARTAVLYWCVLSLTFVLLRLAPGDPATFLLPPARTDHRRVLAVLRFLRS